MKAISTSTAVEMSYFRLSLLSYLRESHPDKAADRSFIAERGDAAAEAAKESLAALREATPKPIAFDDLNFNFGERGKIYEKIIYVHVDYFTIFAL